MMSMSRFTSRVSQFFSAGIFAAAACVAANISGTDPWMAVFYVISAAVGGWMTPGITVIFYRDFHKYITKNTEKYQELEMLGQENSKIFIQQLRTVTQTPMFLYQKISKLHNHAFPQILAQTGAIGHQIHITNKKTPGQGSRQRSRRPATTKSGGGSGKKGDDGDGGGDGEPPRNNNNPLQLLNWTGLAVLFSANEKTLRNQYYLTPWAFPEPIYIPGCRGPRWTPAAIQKWLDNQTYEPKKTKPTQLKNVSRGRPRLAHTLGLVVGGAK